MVYVDEQGGWAWRKGWKDVTQMKHEMLMKKAAKYGPASKAIDEMLNKVIK